MVLLEGHEKDLSHQIRKCRFVLSAAQLNRGVLESLDVLVIRQDFVVRSVINFFTLGLVNPHLFQGAFTDSLDAQSGRVIKLLSQP